MCAAGMKDVRDERANEESNGVTPRRGNGANGGAADLQRGRRIPFGAGFCGKGAMCIAGMSPCASPA